MIARFLDDIRATSVTISGQLQFPAGATGPVPAVIVAHTSAGPVSDVPLAAAAMREAGFATLA